ncbi:hypothetical protein K504DRAFT_255167 [Pleomassaria siparia CBS 279.74]|uniref:Uncharacterized protein n=1 Tax=Pleomassaria siparia CBS 279.74 TaxID=1314801 RepID=A0A6G1KBQ6_9PLEO|nr:hypothetical protein K504DRAFT_255167 [Pleomassaria siparia CBS 279.74]
MEWPRLGSPVSNWPSASQCVSLLQAPVRLLITISLMVSMTLLACISAHNLSQPDPYMGTSSTMNRTRSSSFNPKASAFNPTAPTFQSSAMKLPPQNISSFAGGVPTNSQYLHMKASAHEEIPNLTIQSNGVKLPRPELGSLVDSMPVNSQYLRQGSDQPTMMPDFTALFIPPTAKGPPKPDHGKTIQHRAGREDSPFNLGTPGQFSQPFPLTAIPAPLPETQRFGETYVAGTPQNNLSAHTGDASTLPDVPTPRDWKAGGQRLDSLSPRGDWQLDGQFAENLQSYMRAHNASSVLFDQTAMSQPKPEALKKTSNVDGVRFTETEWEKLGPPTTPLDKNPTAENSVKFVNQLRALDVPVSDDRKSSRRFLVAGTDTNRRTGITHGLSGMGNIPKGPKAMNGHSRIKQRQAHVSHVSEEAAVPAGYLSAFRTTQAATLPNNTPLLNGQPTHCTSPQVQPGGYHNRPTVPIGSQLPSQYCNTDTQLRRPSTANSVHRSGTRARGRRPRSRVHTRSKRSDQGPMPSEADIYPDDAGFGQRATQVAPYHSPPPKYGHVGYVGQTGKGFALPGNQTYGDVYPPLPSRRASGPAVSALSEHLREQAAHIAAVAKGEEQRVRDEAAHRKAFEDEELCYQMAAVAQGRERDEAAYRKAVEEEEIHYQETACWTTEQNGICYEEFLELAQREGTTPWNVMAPPQILHHPSPTRLIIPDFLLETTSPVYDRGGEDSELVSPRTILGHTSTPTSGIVPDERPMSPGQESGSRYGLRFWSIGLSDEWCPPKVEKGTKFRVRPLEHAGWGGQEWAGANGWE